MYFKKLKPNIINTLDIVVLVVALSLLLATLFKINNRQIQMLFNRTKDATVTVSINADNYDTSDFKVGEKMFFSDSDEVAGTIVSVKNIKEKRYTAINNSLMYDYTDKNVGVQIEIKTKIKESNSKKYIGSSVFAACGSRLGLYTNSSEPLECVIDNILVTNNSR